jgi:hypothetical protein
MLGIAMFKRPNGASSPTDVEAVGKGRISKIPEDYRRWRTWEAGVPLGVTLFVFVWLVIDFMLDVSHTHKYISDALVATSGGGDFLVLGALIVLNVFGTIELEDNRRLLVNGEGDLGKTQTLIVGVALLMFYAVIRIQVRTSNVFTGQSAQFLIAVLSTFVLIGVLLWIDHVIWRLHLAKLRGLIRERQFHAQYNWH